MKHRKNIVTFCLLLAGLSFFTLNLKSQTLPQLGKDPIKKVVEAMTLEEKVNLIGGMGRIGDMPEAIPGIRMNDVLGRAGVTYPIPRLGVPILVLADGPAGVRIKPHRKDSDKQYYATAFPVATLLASSWDKELICEVGEVFGNEILEYGIDIILAPGMNIQRNPLGGRNFEYYSEDPYLTGHIASAMVKGIQSKGVGTCIKHFAANSEETNRLEHSSEITERALREIYLRGFEIAVKEADPWTIMSSYNRINGTYTSESTELLTTILRDEWNYNYFVMSDWGAGKNHVAQMKAGNDMIMPGRSEITNSVYEAVQNGTLDEDILNRNVERILTIIEKSPSFRKYQFSDKPNLKANAEIARKTAGESMVLLKNGKKVLPLTNGAKVALFGCTSYENIAGGIGSGGVHKAYNVSLNQGLVNAGFSIDKEVEKIYLDFVKEQKSTWKNNPLKLDPAIPEMELSQMLVDQLAKQMDIAVITIGKNAGEDDDRKEEEFNLTQAETNLIKQISKAFRAQKKKLIVVLNISNVIDVASWRDYADAILLAWQGGQEGGNAIADILSGKVNPSGKLATTFPLAYADVPSYNNFPGTPKNDLKPAYSLYEEGIYVGYRYYNSFGVKTAYEFGYGLSYTEFSYSDLKISNTEFSDKITVNVNIKNKGKIPGKEVVQLYLKAPLGKLDKPENELKGFAKTKLLQPGESQTIQFELTPALLASYDTESSSWMAEKGKYQIQIGTSSLNIRKSANFNLINDIVVEKCHKVLTPVREINELKP